MCTWMMDAWVACVLLKNLGTKMPQNGGAKTPLLTFNMVTALTGRLVSCYSLELLFFRCIPWQVEAENLVDHIDRQKWST